MADIDELDHEIAISSPGSTPPTRDVLPPGRHDFLRHKEAQAAKRPVVSGLFLQSHRPQLPDRSRLSPPDRIETSSSASASARESDSAVDSAFGSEDNRYLRRPFLSTAAPHPFPRPDFSRADLPTIRGIRADERPTTFTREEHDTRSVGTEATESWSTQSPIDALPALWVKLEEQRRNLRLRRREMAAKRREVRSIQRKMCEADNAFMNSLRPLFVTRGAPPRAPDALERQLKELQDLRDDYNAAMSAYESMEDDLIHDEAELHTLESRFFTTLYRSADHQDGSPEGSEDTDDDEGQAEDRPPSRTSLLGISGDLEDDIHPLYRALLDAVGERELAHEHYSEIMTHRDAILYDLEMNLKLDRLRESRDKTSEGAAVLSEAELEELKSAVAGIPARIDASELRDMFGARIRDADLKFLLDFSREEELARESLNDTMMEVRRLRDLCKQKGAMRKYPPYYEEYMIHVAAGDEASPPPSNMTIHRQSLSSTEDEDLGHPFFPILLTNPSHVLLPITPRMALRNAVKLPKDDPNRALRVAHAMKEFDITNLLGESREEDKSDYINRWLLQKLRVSPMEVRVLLSAWTPKVRIVNNRRWQEDVLYFWTRDEAANRPASLFDGPLTPDDDIVVKDPEGGVANSEIELQSRAESEQGDLSGRQDPAAWAARSMF